MLTSFRHTALRWAGAALLTGLAALPSLAQPSQAATPTQTLTVAVDSNLAEAMNAVARDFESRHQGASLKVLPGAAGALLEQMARGTPADVLATGDAETIGLGVQRRLLAPDLRSVFATDTLVLVVPASLSLPVQRLSDLARPEVVRIAMGRQASVPAGRTAREAINAQRMWPSVQRKVVNADDVRQVLDMVAAADVEAGFVYATDVPTAAGRVRVVETLATATPIRYLAHAAATSPRPALARAFIDHLKSEPARAVFKRFGFGVP